MSSRPVEPSTLSGMGVLSTVLESARQTMLLLMRNRLLWFILLAEAMLGLAEFVLAGADRNRLDGRELLSLFSWWFLAGVVLPWTTLYLAVQAVHAEIEDRTFQYLFLRPVRRAPLLVGKWLATLVVAGVVGLFGGASLFLGVAARPSLWENGVDARYGVAFAQVLGLGAVAYAAVGVWFAAALRRPLVCAAIAVILQMVVALLPVSAGVRSITVSDPLRRLLLDRIEPNAHLAEMLWPGERDFRSELVGHPVLSLAVLTAVVLILGMWSHSRSEYDSRHRE